MTAPPVWNMRERIGFIFFIKSYEFQHILTEAAIHFPSAKKIIFLQVVIAEAKYRKCKTSWSEQGPLFWVILLPLASA